MTYLSNAPFALQVSRGLVSGITAVNKFGSAPSGIQTSATDIWSRADATPTQQIWVAPTTARIHAIVSSSDLDGKTASPSSVGARTLKIWGLTSWTTAEVNETVTLDGTTSVNTANSYVIIHRMKVLTAGTTAINVGTITATAATDTTITAVILPTDGQTQMAIYGAPSTQTFYLVSYGLSINDSVAQTRVKCTLEVNETPDSSPLNVRFTRKWELQIQNSGTSFANREFEPYIALPGPCIIKVQGTANTPDVDGSAAFNGYLVTN